MDNKNQRGGAYHQITVINRENIAIEGVIHVESFDDQEIVLATELGMLSLGGQDLHIKELNLEQGKLSVEGYLKSLDYSDERKAKGMKAKSKGLIGRLLK